MSRNKCFRNIKGAVVFWLGSIIPYLYIKHLLTYYDFLRILLFLEIWIVIKEVGVANNFTN